MPLFHVGQFFVGRRGSSRARNEADFVVVVVNHTTLHSSYVKLFSRFNFSPDFFFFSFSFISYFYSLRHLPAGWVGPGTGMPWLWFPYKELETLIDARLYNLWRVFYFLLPLRSHSISALKCYLRQSFPFVIIIILRIRKFLFLFLFLFKEKKQMIDAKLYQHQSLKQPDR